MKRTFLILILIAAFTDVFGLAYFWVGNSEYYASMPTSVLVTLNSAPVNVTTITLDSTVVYKTIQRRVYKIGKDAFINAYTTLTSLTIPSSIEVIEAGTFFGCTNLKEITVNDTIPPALDPTGLTPAFMSTIKVYVPSVSLATYKARTKTWNLFDLQPITTAVETPIESNYLIKISDNSVEISNVYDKSIKAFDLSGRIVFETRKAQETEKFTVSNKGIYILSIDNFMKKIAIY